MSEVTSSQCENWRCKPYTLVLPFKMWHDRISNLLLNPHPSSHPFSPSYRFAQSQVVRVFSILSIPAFSVFFIFAVTLALFPTITSKIESTQKCER